MSILGIDFGLKRIGIAISLYGDFPKPLGVFSKKGFDKNISVLIESYNVDKIVLGYPEGKLRETVRGFGARLAKKTKIPIDFIDETLTSYYAKYNLVNLNIPKKKRAENLDAYAACIILENYLDKK